MNLLNFVKPVDKKTKKSILIWSILSVILVATTFGIIACIQIRQLNLLSKLKQEHKELEEYINNQKYIFEKKKELTKQLSELKSKQLILDSRGDLILKILDIIIKAIPQDVLLTEFNYSTNKIILKGHAKTWQNLSFFIKNLNNKLGKLKLRKTQVDLDTAIINFELEIDYQIQK